MKFSSCPFITSLDQEFDISFVPQAGVWDGRWMFGSSKTQTTQPAQGDLSLGPHDLVNEIYMVVYIYGDVVQLS